jgi:hypothetical protein
MHVPKLPHSAGLKRLGERECRDEENLGIVANGQCPQFRSSFA